MTAKKVAIVNSVISTTITIIKMATLPLNWGETVSELVIGVVLSGRVDIIVIGVLGIIRSQSASGEEMFTHRGGPILPVSGGFDRVSVHEEKQ